MERSKLFNRRFLYQDTKELQSFPRIIEDIDLLIDDLMQIEATSNHCIVYGSGVEIFSVGREVVGNDPNLKHHDSIKLKDFVECQGERYSNSFNSLEDLIKFLSINLEGFSFYRLSFISLDEVDVFFFNLEK